MRDPHGMATSVPSGVHQSGSARASASERPLALPFGRTACPRPPDKDTSSAGPSRTANSLTGAEPAGCCRPHFLRHSALALVSGHGRVVCLGGGWAKAAKEMHIWRRRHQPIVVSLQLCMCALHLSQTPGQRAHGTQCRWLHVESWTAIVPAAPLLLVAD